MALLLLAAATCFYFYYSFAVSSNSSLTGETVIDIPPGSGFSTLLRKLKEKNIDVPEIPAKVVGRVLGIDKRVKLGEYMLTPPMSSLQILETITNGKGILRSLLVKEGYNRWDIKTAWSAISSFNHQEFEELLTDQELMKKMGVPSEREILRASGMNPLSADRFSSLEGFLFPETYSFQKYDSTRNVILEMLQQFDGRAREILSKHEWSKTPLGFYRLLTLASIVEKESGNGEEQPFVASVFWNRLSKKMRLQSDPTTIYGLMPNFDGNLKRIHLETFGIFNTYKIPELPVGPICNPGEKALRAVLNPASTEYLYFVSKGNGQHIFATNYNDHTKNVRNFQLHRK
jgi:UPF0755 protein